MANLGRGSGTMKPSAPVSSVAKVASQALKASKVKKVSLKLKVKTGK